MINLPKLFKKSVGLLLVFVSSFIFFTQIFFPEVRASLAQTYISPVDSEYLSLKRLNAFSFKELARGGDKFQNRKADVPKVFHLSLPKLGIAQAVVETNSDKLKLKESLGHYAGSSLPGEPGNTFIYGHSTLPALYNPKNYETIFTYLYTLDYGDEIIIEYGNKTIKFVVQGQQVLSPEEVEPLGLGYLNYPSLTLMTCTPPGRVDQRLLVFAKKVY